VGSLLAVSSWPTACGTRILRGLFAASGTGCYAARCCCGVLCRIREGRAFAGAGRRRGNCRELASLDEQSLSYDSRVRRQRSGRSATRRRRPPVRGRRSPPTSRRAFFSHRRVCFADRSGTDRTMAPGSVGSAAVSRLRRGTYAACYLVFIVSGHAAARLAGDFRALGAATNRFGPLPLLLQVPVFACWVLVRPISIAAFAGCCAFAQITSPRAPSP
jgi:hypothetical protein